MKLGEIGRSLSHRNFRLFFAGQSASLIGTWIQQTAMTWLVYRLSHSAFLLGVVGFSTQIPVLVLAPVAGVLSDRSNRHRIIVTTQTLLMLQALVVGVLTVTNVITVEQIIALSVTLGCINAFDMPTRQAFMTEMLSNREDLANAIALNSSMVNGARLIGPSLAGFLIGLVGEGLCFLINGISYIGVIAALLAMRIVTRRPEVSSISVLHGLGEGFAYAFSFPPVRAILLLVALIGLGGMPYAVLMPIFADQIVQGIPQAFGVLDGAQKLGLLMGASGIGALSGSLYLASRGTVLGLGRWIAAMSALFGVGLFAFSLSEKLWLSMICLLVLGFSVMVQLASCNTILQTIVEERMRGRVMSLYTMAFLGMTPLGSLGAGALASAIGAPRTLQIGAVFCVVGGALFALQLPALRKEVRPIYERMGILPTVVRGIQAATELIPPEE
jgi:MFS family permease